MAIGGNLHYNLTPDEVKVLLLEELSPNKSVIIEEEEDDSDENNK